MKPLFLRGVRFGGGVFDQPCLFPSQMSDGSENNEKMQPPCDRGDRGILM